MTEVLLKEKTKTPKVNEEVFIPFQQLWDLARREHQELFEGGFIHVTGHLRFPKPQPENMRKYSKMFSKEASFFVVSSQGLVFFGFNFRIIEKRNYKLVPIETIKGTRVLKEVKQLSLSDITKRRLDPLCIL